MPVCFVAGWTNENTACGVLAVAALLLIYDFVAKRRIRLWRLLAFAAQLLGAAVMLLAPGNYARPSGAESRGMILDLVYGAAVVSYCLLRYAGVIALLIAAALLVCRKKRIMPDVMCLAMMGGGAFFGKVGSFEEGYAFDAVVLDDSVLPHPQRLNLAERMERAVYLGLDEKKITAKYVAGKKIL